MSGKPQCKDCFDATPLAWYFNLRVGEEPRYDMCKKHKDEAEEKLIHEALLKALGKEGLQECARRI